MVCKKVMAGVAVVAGLIALGGPALAVDQLGCRRVGFDVDRDIIAVGRQDGTFKAIQLRVSGNAITLRDLKVVYGNGNVDDINVRSNIRSGSKTRWIDLKGNRRNIREIAMTYTSRPNFRGQAQVCVYGR